MAGTRWILLALGASPLLAATSAIDAGEVRRGALAVGDRTSEQPALRGEARPSDGFRLGASFRAWVNSAAAVRFDASHTTGDGGDAEALAIDCGDERLSFGALEEARRASGVTEQEVARMAGEPDPALPAAWHARRAEPPKPCR